MYASRTTILAGVLPATLPGDCRSGGNDSLPGRAKGRARMRLPLLILALCGAAAVLAGCAVRTPDVYRGFMDQAGPDAPIAIVRNGSAWIYAIDGRRIEHADPDKFYNEVHLQPGPHRVTLTRWFGVSVLIVPSGSIQPVSHPFTVDMQAGHVYELHADRTTGPGFRVYFWIEDAATQEVVAGSRMECGFWC